MVKKMSDYKILSDTVRDSDYINNGIFTAIKKAYGTPPDWLTDDASVNIGYYLLHSGNKIISPFIKKELGDEETLTEAKNDEIARVILAMYKINWDKLYNAMTIDYSPIENVDEYLTETTDTTGNTKTSGNGTDAGTDTHAKTGSDSTSDTGTDTMAETGKDTLTISDTSTSTDSGTDSLKISGTSHSLDSGKDTVRTSGTDTDTLSGSDTLSRTGTDSTANTGDDVVKTSGNDGDTNDVSGESSTKKQFYGYNSTDPADADLTKTNMKQGSKSTHVIDETQTTTHGLKSTETLNLNDTTNYGKVDTLTKEESQSTEYGKEVANDKDETDTTTYGKKVSNDKDETDTTTYGKTDTRTLDTLSTTKYNNTDTETVNLTHTTSGTEDRTGKADHTLHRHGNVGVTTNQYMINEEWELRKKSFLEHVYQDCDRLLTLPIY